ncbi:MAG: T9SS type A sorting domain-containing protein, partial [Candidatus Hydrothermia bacterium]
WQNNVANSWATSVDVSRDGSTIACGTGYANGTIRVYDISSSTPLWTYAGYGGYGSGVWGIAVSGDGGHIIAVSWGDTATSDTFKVITVHDRSSSVPLLTVNGQSEPGSLFSCDISDDGVYATAGGKAVHAYTFGNGGEVYAIIIGASEPVNVGTEAILSPPKWVQLSGNYQVQARFRNYGNAAASFPVYFRIDTAGGNVYSSSSSITNLGPGSPQTITFSPNWTPPNYNLYTAYAWTELTGDTYSGDDTISLVIKCFHDAMTVQIDQPFDTITINQPLTPGVTVKNNGSYTEAFTVIFNVYDSASTLIYSDTANSAALAPDAQARVTFSPQWAPPAIGSYTAEAIAGVTDDYYRNNDTIRKPFRATYEIIYDDGVPGAYYIVSSTYDNNKFAVRFTPTVGPPLYITQGRIYVNQANKPFDYVILCPDASGRPDTVAPYTTVNNVSATSAPGWAFFDFVPDVYLTTGSDIWLVIHWPPSSPGAPAVGADNNWFVDTRSWWYNNTNGWNNWTAHDWMIRVTQFIPPTEVAEVAGKPKFWVGMPSPNPARNQTILSYSLPDETDVQVKLYTADGRLAKEVFSGKQAPGVHKLMMEPDVPAGVYFLRFTAGEQKVVRKLTIIR